MKLPYLSALASLAAASACSASPELASEIAPSSPTKDPAMSAATSPTGEPHPGDIVNNDKVDGRTWTVKASDVPPTIGWVQVGDSWRAVVRIEITGTREQRRITKFGADGTMLESTVQAPPPPPPRPADPVPVPTPTED